MCTVPNQEEDTEKQTVGRSVQLWIQFQLKRGRALGEGRKIYLLWIVLYE